MDDIIEQSPKKIVGFENSWIKNVSNLQNYTAEATASTAWLKTTGHAVLSYLKRTIRIQMFQVR